MIAPRLPVGVGIAPDPAFIALACSWMRDPAQWLLGFVWAAYDEMRTNPPAIDTRDLERSITQLLEPRVRDAMTGDEPFYIQHGSFERETMAAPPAQPPAYDLAFVLRADERIMWPLEAKVLATPGALADYERDIREQYLTCRYAPFSASGAMLGYLLSGTPAQALSRIATKLGCSLDPVSEFPTRPHRISVHRRSVPAGKTYPMDFGCHHLVLEYPGLARHQSSSETQRDPR
ncbi:hypothetical protein DO71_2806 [Burkholderia pseudomallei]|uniref:hypothetical protein n=1 Tax=Burkholderia pseudomallei TaxID=28450 RepID=UPI00050EB04C|nr:hypothetical protein [Burkholderia pseudomallei]KGC74423.1 hypothetical protein DO71_2806 [Burkholderia pseudomallei]KGV21118.1 hypothetical protein X891_4766 [Burkholderia pseudomallei TSV 43]KGV31433.1 hypothetical protein X893_3430 [Burkholderia pseudomallei TSV 31]